MGKPLNGKPPKKWETPKCNLFRFSHEVFGNPQTLEFLHFTGMTRIPIFPTRAAGALLWFLECKAAAIGRHPRESVSCCVCGGTCVACVLLVLLCSCSCGGFIMRYHALSGSCRLMRRRLVVMPSSMSGICMNGEWLFSRHLFGVCKACFVSSIGACCTLACICSPFDLLLV